MTDDLKCNLPSIEKMAPWLDGEKEGDENCRTCCIQPASSWYLQELQDAGESAHVKELQDVFKKGDILTIAKKLDSIKSDVGEALREKLERFDCLCQSFEQEEAI